jgi:hypothetical protein
MEANAAGRIRCVQVKIVKREFTRAGMSSLRNPTPFEVKTAHET